MDGVKVEKTPLIEKKKEERDESTCVMHIIEAWALLYLKELSVSFRLTVRFLNIFQDCTDSWPNVACGKLWDRSAALLT